MKKATSVFTICILLSTTTFAQPGTLDSSFGIDGRVMAPKGGSANSIAIQTDGKMVVAGDTYHGTDEDFAVVRYTQNGTIDSGFGSKGKAVADFGPSDNAQSVAIQADGKIVVEGGIYYGSKYDLALVRFNTNGRIDKTFGNMGKVIIDFGGAYDGYAGENCMALQADGKIVVAGSNSFAGGSNFALARYLSSGAIDNTFGVGGKVVSDFSTYDYAFSLAIQVNGMIVLAGQSNNDFALVRYKQNGNIDLGFGNNGISVTDFGKVDYGKSVVIQPDGKLVLAGYIKDLLGDNEDFAIARYLKNGQPDNSFAVNGKEITDFGFDDYGLSVALQANGKIVVAGYSQNGNGGSYKPVALVRYRPNGNIDSAFGTNGKVITYYGIKIIAQAHSVAIQADGKIVVAGFLSNYFGVLRYNNTSTPNIAKGNYMNLRDNSFNKTAYIQLYPNPVKDILHIEGLSSATPQKISVIDLSGKVLQQNFSSNSICSFDVKQLPAGMYYVKIYEGGKTTLLKFIKE